MAIQKKFQHKHASMLRDVRPVHVRAAEAMRESSTATAIYSMIAVMVYMEPMILMISDLLLFLGIIYFFWLRSTPTILPFKLPGTAGIKDKHNVVPGGGIKKAEGILYLGNEIGSGEEIWFNNTDARTHILYLGTTGSGKTEGLKSLAVNALCWGSGFIYIDGKADTDLWSTISSMCRRFGRDDDLLIMNYMTGGGGGRTASNTLNPFSSGSASYLVNMLVSLMPDAEGDNAMWKDRAVALISALMPCLVWKRENQNIPLSISVIRKYLGFCDVISLSRDESVPEHLREGVHAYLGELPGYVDEAFDDDGNEKAMPPDAPQVDTSVPRQQHGYLSMQFTRSMQSLGDDYGFIFDTQAADVDMMDVVLNRRMLITLIPALEKSSDETANLGKIIATTLKGMMGSTLGHTVEGDTATAIENKPTNSPTPFVAIFDEVGYYTAAGMAVMAAQARSLGFCLVYAAQDLPALEKRVKEEARSITANCNIKLFGKLEDPTQTKDFFEKTVGQALVTEVSGFSSQRGGSGNYDDGMQAGVQTRARADYDTLRGFTEGMAICAFGEEIVEMQVYYSNPGHAKAMRVQRFLPIPPPGEDVLKAMKSVDSVLKRFRSSKWDPRKMAAVTESDNDIMALAEGFTNGKKADLSLVEIAALCVATVAEHNGLISEEDLIEKEDVAVTADGSDTVPVTGDRTGPAGLGDTVPKVDGGPLSWLDVIGAASGESSLMTEGAKTPPPVTEENNETTGDADAPVMPWDLVEETAAESENISVVSVSDVIPEAAETVDDGAPLSWADVMAPSASDNATGNTANPAPNAPPEALPESVTTPVLETEAPVPAPVTDESLAVVPDVVVEPQAAPVAPTVPQEKKPSAGGMNWADVIGASIPEDPNKDKE